MLLYAEGLLLGVPAIFFIGPVLLTLLQASVEHGFKSGFAVATGITASDVVCVALAYVGVARFFEAPGSKMWVGVLGGAILMGFGLGLLLRTPQLPDVAAPLGKSHFFALFAKGFAVNFINPFVFAYWIGALGVMASKHSLTPLNTLIYFGGAITVIYTTDVLKVLLAERLKHNLTHQRLYQINRFAGVGLVLFGLILIWRVL